MHAGTLVRVFEEPALQAQYFSTLVLLAPGAEAMLERASETSPV